MSVHQPQHLIASALQGDVEVRHEAARTGYVVYQLVRQQVRLDGGDAVALHALHLVERTHQVEEALAGALAEVADVHAGDDNLPSSLGYGLTGLCH